ncbi:hypothetical protein N8I77_012804 [Diaporthe amygdali]|uniref:IQ domain-containing protein IQM6 n=1 Tax=Phomopsis amygdali TaxID=1214568 RepID=A0AAD9S1M9_PHOAM|nr:hypothetical protein N8I77_012804 [Diaporthe amygdali]
MDPSTFDVGVAHATPRDTTSSPAPPNKYGTPTNLPTPPQTPSVAQAGANGACDDYKLPVTMEGPNSQGQSQSNASLDSATSVRSKKQYMDSLVAPSSEEMSRISQVQLTREQEEKRKSRDREKEQRRSMEAPQASPGLEAKTRPHRSSLFSRHKENSPSHNTSVLAAAVASATAAGTGHDSDDILRHRAATMIQRTYRGYKTRREMQGLGLNADTRWTHAIKELQFRAVTTPRSREDATATITGNDESEGKEDGNADAAKRSKSARYNWHKIATIARRAGGDMDDESSSSSDSDSESGSGPSTPEKRREARQKREEAKARRRKDAMMMGLQYFLEMVDLKHRYGSNLRQYHEEWKKADTHENFFYWLDHGEGRHFELSTCPRDRLEREQVRYLSREERQYYLVNVDSEGRLCWAKNGARINTTEDWRDSIQGIVPIGDTETPAFQPKTTYPNQPRLFPSDPSSRASSISDASESEREAARAAKYASPGVTDAKGVKKVTHISASTIFNTLLRKSVRKNTWIFVADTSFRLYVGIKDSGAFQHSSFVQGSRISAAGLIKIKNGRLTSLSPLSGHYRPPASNFRAFVRNLKEDGVDTSHVSISKSYAVLVGLEMYTKTRQKGKKLIQRTAHKKDKVIHPEEVQKREEEARDKSQSAETERQFLEKQAKKQQEEEEKQREENKATVKVMQKLKLTPTVPDSQKGEAQGGIKEKDDSKEGGGSPALGGADESKTSDAK